VEEVCAKEEEMVEFSTQRVLEKKTCRARLHACMTFLYAASPACAKVEEESLGRALKMDASARCLWPSVPDKMK